MLSIFGTVSSPPWWFWNWHLDIFSYDNLQKYDSLLYKLEKSMLSCALCSHMVFCSKKVYGGITLWSYQLLQKHLLLYHTKLHYVDFYGPLMPSSHIDIWYLVSHTPDICQKSWKMSSRKKDQTFTVGSNWHSFWCLDS